MLKLLLFLAIFNLADSQANAELKILSPKLIIKIVGHYPSQGSPEELADFEILKNFQSVRSEEECSAAALEEKATLENLFAGKDGPLSKKEAKKVMPYLLKAYAETGVNIFIAKKTFKRPRPYEVDSQIIPCIGLEESYAYPSGHTTMARVLARLLSNIYPERAAAFMKRADEVARNRVLGGVHHPSDIVAGNKLGDYLGESLWHELVANSESFSQN